jgi:hypothetical protein
MTQIKDVEKVISESKDQEDQQPADAVMTQMNFIGEKITEVSGFPNTPSEVVF